MLKNHLGGVLGDWATRVISRLQFLPQDIITECSSKTNVIVIILVKHIIWQTVAAWDYE